MNRPHRLPPNPYRRSPIKKLSELAGRAAELKKIRYYLKLVESGESSHLALLGQRGIGKTSLLNAVAEIAKEEQLLGVQIDLNEHSTTSVGRFWKEFYQSLALTMAQIGCWGGIHGKIYPALLQMINSRRPEHTDMAVLQVPYLLACHHSEIDSFSCPDALVVYDLQECLKELKDRGIKGLAFLVDEADCLGRNLALLQMLRNVFQKLHHVSLVLAGTEAVFGVLSEVFSPIPRQFHRIDVRQFAAWPDTLDLVTRALPENLRESVQPDVEDVQSLHSICGGAPDEVQLYCHHMYRRIEGGTGKRMSLSPAVFRDVLREYRANSPANLDRVLNAIERLPDSLLFRSKWVSRTRLSLDENILVSRLRSELKEDRLLTEEEARALASEMTNGYRVLADQGISEVADRIQLVGAQFTAAYWKSFVEVERNERWIWDDAAFAISIRRQLMVAISNAVGAHIHFEVDPDQGAFDALKLLREGKRVAEIRDGLGDLVLSCLIASEENLVNAVDCVFVVESPAGKQTSRCRFIEDGSRILDRSDFEKWVHEKASRLSERGIRIEISAFTRWTLPSNVELHRLGRIGEYTIPGVFGPSPMDSAIKKYDSGDLAGCIDAFTAMLDDRDDPFVRNNLAFCQILNGEVAAGLSNVNKALEARYDPLFEMNKGVGEFVQGNEQLAGELLQSALKWLDEQNGGHDTSAYSVLIVEPAAKRAEAHRDLSIDAALAINLFRLKLLDADQVSAKLNSIDRKNAPSWLSKFARLA